ncbi:MAG TPA: hypothetical protein VK614_03200 [Allosphingosinicella sp.]|nr:hypothetical protein [Allosphingosinicella sp.]
MKHTLTPHRRAAAWLFAAAALPFTPLAAQDVPVVNAPPPEIVAPPAPAPAPALPPISVAPAPRPVTITPAPAPTATRAPAPAVTRRATRTVHTATRTAASPRAPAPVRQTAPAPAPAPVAVAPEPVPVTTPVPAAVNGPAPAQVGGAATAVEPRSGIMAIWPFLAAGALLLIAAIALFARRRRRAAEEEVYYEEAYEEPAVEAAPEPSFTHAEAVVAAAPVVTDEVAVVDSDAADVEALAAGSEPIAGRPWIEFLMRPLRAGTSRDDAIVQFELTVGNTGSVAAKDVKISTWMVAGGQGTDMERSLIEPPADASVSEVDIAAGDGARVDGQISLSKDGLTEPVLPVVVADARYTLPDGSEGRTHASFAIGIVEGEELAPFPIDRSSGLSENVEARLHGEPERV